MSARLKHLRARDSWTMGTFAELVVAGALPGATQSDSTFAAHDLSWEGISIEVKCSTERQSGVPPESKPSPGKWSVPTHFAWDHDNDDWHPGEKQRWAQVYVLARHEGFDHRLGWSFYVVPCWWLDQRGSATVTESGLRAAGWVAVSEVELPGAVSSAAASTPPLAT